MFVLTIDQRGSRRSTDKVPSLIQALDGDPALVRGPERTVGDEVQAVIEDPDAVVRVVLGVLRSGQWSVGVGAGPVDEPMPAEARAGSGAAFVHARHAVERAKSRQRPAPVAVDGVRPDRAAEAEAVLTLLASVASRRTGGGWDAIDAWLARGDGVTQEEIAADLGVSQQAVSQRLAAALWDEERAARPVVARLLAEAES
ncbi:sigma factor-like helix-turn-helix DNA-binding protein [Isoptericola sp. b441]|uniref:Sigma factor-like helix-turn-helix DNA-binding protein n=1 Tax=Actinotalea lenta TaxID=3064654 RepID=A0ABT9DB39_9CELL|nr:MULTISPECIES: sigma factor-like helix-turn-helix DNA-binding protein [unclassified Isoptericola]MDO8107785.1 sigma factor-like helix-turn-helix DNA-binding protein [Isoptericola sp. b441]MDO8120544.1 sigma factor-like helix-turn-helix DNA-binding protein [Isoptericola sp. b490]